MSEWKLLRFVEVAFCHSAIIPLQHAEPNSRHAQKMEHFEVLEVTSFFHAAQLCLVGMNLANSAKFLISPADMEGIAKR